MINTLKELWHQLPDKQKREFANFVSKEMQKTSNETAIEVLQYLNTKLQGLGLQNPKRPLQAKPCNLRNINARLAEGNGKADLIAVIDMKCKDWAKTQMAKYLRPSTLFNDARFSEYVTQVDIKIDEPKPKLRRPTNDAEWMQLAKKCGAGSMASYTEIWSLATVAYDNGRLKL